MNHMTLPPAPRLARALKFLSLLSVLVVGLVSGARSADGTAHLTDWFYEAKWGVCTHYLGDFPGNYTWNPANYDKAKPTGEMSAEAWSAQIDAFDVEGFAKQVAETGAKRLIFTIGQNTGHYCSPNATYDKIVGRQPSRCSKRDLIADLAKAFKPHGVSLMVYLPSGAPGMDPIARQKLQWGQKGGWAIAGQPEGRRAEFQRHWEAVIREWSLRWGDSVRGWWIDGVEGEEMYDFADEPNFKSLVAAIKAGNPRAIVALAADPKYSQYSDYTSGNFKNFYMEKLSANWPSGRFLPGGHVPCMNPSYDTKQLKGDHKVQSHAFSFLGNEWGRGDKPRFSDAKVIEWTRRIVSKGGVVTWDFATTRDGKIPEPLFNQLKAVGRAMQEDGPRKAQ